MIPTDDPEAWAWNPEYAWVFDKLRLALSQGLYAAPHGLVPPRFPVFSKPIFNFGGMGAGSCLLSDISDYRRNATPGHMWMSVLTGTHVSTDAAIVNGDIAWIRQATGKPTTQGMFDYWNIHAEGNEILERSLRTWISGNMRGYTGMLNTETIGGTIIDAHLRFADQWPDLYGAGWVEALVGLYRDKEWFFADAERREAYSLALFMPHGCVYRHPPEELVAAVCQMPDVSSIQITFYEDKRPENHSMPPGGFRVALVNSWDLAAGQQARNRLEEWFSHALIMERATSGRSCLSGAGAIASVFAMRR
jgi:hypothetical protein